jgi:hypothetical protein
MAQYQVYFDTREGEQRYNVDFGDDEAIEHVLRDIVGELTERGHIMQGLSTGDLKVIWGGREGRELDLARTLPEQGVRPNDVLRVLVEMYEGGAQSLRADRIDSEWVLLERLQRLNRGQVELLGRSATAVEDTFRVRLRGTPGLAGATGVDMDVRSTHDLRLVFTRFFPDVPIECYADTPLFHPNVKTETGFVCLWEQASARDTAVQALARFQAMAALRMANLGGPHVMNPNASAWLEQTGRPLKLIPLTLDELRVYEVRDGTLQWIEPARQLFGSRRRLH